MLFEEELIGSILSIGYTLTFKVNSFILTFKRKYTSILDRKHCYNITLTPLMYKSPYNVKNQPTSYFRISISIYEKIINFQKESNLAVEVLDSIWKPKSC